jgi:hypothetical protein
VHVAEKYCVERSAVIDLVQQRCGVDLNAVASEDDVATAIGVLNHLRLRGLDAG